VAAPGVLLVTAVLLVGVLVVGGMTIASHRRAC
jgi:hypothetical protein